MKPAADASLALDTQSGQGAPAARPGGLTPPEKAAVIIGALGAEAAGPLLELMDEAALHAFTAAMSRLRKVDARDVRETIAEFLDALGGYDTTVRGGISQVREVLGPHVNEALLGRLIDSAETPSPENVWKKLAKVGEDALAEFLMSEHPQTAAVILSKLGADHAAKILNRFDPDRARDVVMGITRASSLDPSVIEEIGASVSRELLRGQLGGGARSNPAERVGSILDYTSTELRDHVLGHIETSQPTFAAEVRRKMFTFEDIPARIEPRDAAMLMREVELETLLKAMRHAIDNDSATVDFLLRNISSRMADQMRQDLAELGRLRRKDGEAAQSEVVAIIRALEAAGRLKLTPPEEEH